MLHKSLPAISFLKATKSRDLSFLKLICLTVASTFVTLRQHQTEQWSERKLSGEGVPLMILSELRVIIRSKICPITCVGDFTCWVRHNDSNRSANAMVSASSLTSRWTLKSPYMQIGTLDSTNDSRYSLNSGKKVLEVIGWAAEYGGLYTITSLSCKDKPSIIYSENSKEVFSPADSRRTVTLSLHKSAVPPPSMISTRIMKQSVPIRSDLFADCSIILG